MGNAAGGDPARGARAAFPAMSGRAAVWAAIGVPVGAVLVGAMIGAAGIGAATISGTRGPQRPAPTTAAVVPSGGAVAPATPAPSRVSRGAPAAALGGDGPAPADRHVFTRPLMGTPFRIVVAAEDGEGARGAAERAFARIADLEAVLSDYDPGSELSRLSDAAGGERVVPVSADLWRVLAAAKRWAERTGGAFDPTVGALTRVWRRAARRGSIPPAADVAATLPTVGHRRMELDPDIRAVGLEAPGMRLDLGGIGKGYAADAALQRLAALGFPAALVDAGGDVVAGDPPPGEEGWRVALPGSCVVGIAHAALATSGSGLRSVTVDGVRHSHVLDPRTGAALTHGRTVTVLAPTAMEADVLASALTVMDPREGRALVRATPGAAARILEPGGAVSRTGPAGGAEWLLTPDCSSLPSDPEAVRP